MKSPGTVMERDIPPLYSVTHSYRVNVGVLVTAAIRHQAGPKNKAIYLGGMITRILKNLKLWPTTRGPTDVGPKPKPLPRDPFSQWSTPKVAQKGFNIEALGIELPPYDTAHFSAGNLARLEKNQEEIKKNQVEFKKIQDTMVTKQNGIIELLRTIANHLGCAIPACLCGSPTRESREMGESSQPAALPPPPLPVEQFPVLNREELAKGVLLSTSEEEVGEAEAEAEHSGSEGSAAEEGDEGEEASGQEEGSGSEEGDEDSDN